MASEEGDKIYSEITGRMPNDVKLIDPSTQTASIQAAVDAARKSDVAIVVVGENESTNREAWAENHLGSDSAVSCAAAPLTGERHPYSFLGTPALRVGCDFRHGLRGRDCVTGSLSHNDRNGLRYAAQFPLRILPNRRGREGFAIAIMAGSFVTPAIKNDSSGKRHRHCPSTLRRLHV